MAAVCAAAVGLSGCAVTTSGAAHLTIKSPPSSRHVGSFPPPPVTHTPTVGKAGPTVDQLISRFDGSWYGHGRAMKVITDQGKISYRIYKWCGDDPTPPCDEMQGTEIIDGGVITFRLDTAYSAGSATVAEGLVESSTDPRLLPGHPLTARVQSYLLTLSLFPGTPFCATTAPAGRCGA